MPKLGGGGIQVGIRRIVAAKHKQDMLGENQLFSAGGARYHHHQGQYEPEPHPDAIIDSPMQSQYFGKEEVEGKARADSAVIMKDIKDMCTQIDFGEDDISALSHSKKTNREARVRSSIGLNDKKSTEQRKVIIQLRGDLSMSP